MSKVVLITGTSSGLGLKSAVLFAQKGYKVYASMRSLSKKDALLKEAEEKQIKINILQLDVCDQTSVTKAISTLITEEGHIDILINNAGAGFAKTTENSTEEEMLWVTDVNYHGVVRCTKAVLSYMRRQKVGYIINITSVGGLVGQPFNEMYCASKFAVEGYTESMASYLHKGFGIHFSIVEPGGIATEFFTSASKVTDLENLPQDEYLPIFQQYMAGMQKRGSESTVPVFQSPEQVADVVLELAENSKPPLRVRTSQWGEDLCKFKTAGDLDGTKQTDAIVKSFLT